MALVAAAPTRQSFDSNTLTYFGKITVTGSYVTGGVTFDLTPLGAISSGLPDRVIILEQPLSGVTASGYDFLYGFGTTIANGVIQAFSSGGTQAAQSTFASLNIVSLSYIAVFPRI